MEYTIENDYLRARIQSKGAELCSVVKKATGEEMLWQADPAVWNRHAPILFPYCGRLKDGRFTHKGVVYEGGQHGFARDLEHTLTAQGTDNAALCLEANALTMEKYPFAFKLFTGFRLSGETLHHTVRVVNDGDEEMPFAIGFHPGFACPFDEMHKASDYVLRFEQPESPTVIETGEEDGLVTGKTRVYFENQTDIPLSDGFFDHDSTCFTKVKSKSLSLVEKDTGRCVRVSIEDFPYVLMWSAKGAIRFVCIEPWYGVPDTRTASGVWTEKPDTIRLAPGESWERDLAMTFAR